MTEECKTSNETAEQKEFSGIENKIIKLKGQLDQIQARMRDPSHTHHLFKEEKELKLQLEKWSLIEEGITRQKSRIQWLNTRDSITEFFYASMKVKTCAKSDQTVTKC